VANCNVFILRAIVFSAQPGVAAGGKLQCLYFAGNRFLGSTRRSRRWQIAMSLFCGQPFSRRNPA
jgi:hypothetical protein